MNKKDSIARQILGWKTNCKGSWYDAENEVFVNEAYFKPDKFLEHAMIIVKKLEEFGFSYNTDGRSQVSFNNIHSVGHTLPEAITNGAYSLIQNDIFQVHKR